MNYIIGMLIAMTLLLCLFAFPVPTIIGAALALAWWIFRGRDRHTP